MMIPSYESSKSPVARKLLVILAAVKLMAVFAATLASLQAMGLAAAGMASSFLFFTLLVGAILAGLPLLAAHGLRQARAWGWLASVAVAFLNLPSLCLPLAAGILWFLLPDELRVSIEEAFRKAKSA